MLCKLKFIADKRVVVKTSTVLLDFAIKLGKSSGKYNLLQIGLCNDLSAFTKLGRASPLTISKVSEKAFGHCLC